MGLDLSAILAARACGGGGSGGADGKNAYIRFSSSPDGTGMTAAWSEGQSYVGFTTAHSAPTSPSQLVWCRFVGSGTGSAGGTTWTSGAIAALLDCLDRVTWVGATDGTDCVGALRTALGLPEAGSEDD